MKRKGGIAGRLWACLLGLVLVTTGLSADLAVVKAENAASSEMTESAQTSEYTDGSTQNEEDGDTEPVTINSGDTEGTSAEDTILPQTDNMDSNGGLEAASDQGGEESADSTSTDEEMSSASSTTYESESTISDSASTDSGIVVSVSYAADTFGTETQPTLVVSDIAKATDEVQIADKDVIDAAGVDISFTDTEGNMIQPQEGKSVSVTITLPRELGTNSDTEADTNTEIIVLHKTEEISDVTVSEDGKEETFTSDSFSPFYVARVAAQADGSAIYLNGQSGDDSKDGMSAENAVKTFARAKELATNNQDIQTIYVTGTTGLSGDVSLEGTNAKIVREGSFTGDLFEVNGETVSLSNITIDGNGGNVTATGSLIKVTGGTLDIQTDATLTNNNANKAALYVAAGTLNIADGEISNNTSTSWGGGITVWGVATVNMTGGTISDNNGAAGGGLYLRGSGKDDDKQAHLNMSGGSVSSNISSDFGGGIYVGANTIATITAGDINYNVSNGHAWGGGGIYVNSDEHQPNLYSNGKLYIYNVEIANNSTTGGVPGYDSVLSSCDTGMVDVSLTDGAVIHDNGAANTVLVYRQASSSSYEISPIMLGGKPYNWVDEDGKSYGLGAINLTSDDAGWNYMKSSVSTSDGTVSGLDRVKTHIIGNKSTYLGAAIGTNGDVYIGKSDGDVTINLEKKWGESITEKERPESVNVNVYATDGNGEKTEIGYVTLSKENGWKETISHLPKYDSDGKEYAYSYEEDSNYYAEIDTTKEDIDSDSVKYDVIITNNLKGALTVSKTVSGEMADRTRSFPFTVTLSDETLNGTFGDMTFENGVAKIELKDGDSLTAEGLTPGKKYTVSEGTHDGYAVSAQVDGEATDTAAGTIESGKTSQVSFDNKFISPVSVTTPSVEKKLSGDKPEKDSTFTFSLTPSDASNPMPEGSKDGAKTVSITGAGTAGFGDISFTKAGTYEYSVSEVKGEDTHYTYDSSTYKIVYTVTEDKESGKLTATQSITKDGTDQNSVIFTNKYTAEKPNTGDTTKPSNENPNTGDTTKPSNQNPNAGDTTKPSNQNPNTGNSGNTGGSPTSTGSVKTGDTTPIGLYAGLLAAAVAVLIIVLVVRNRKARRS